MLLLKRRWRGARTSIVAPRGRGGSWLGSSLLRLRGPWRGCLRDCTGWGSARTRVVGRWRVGYAADAWDAVFAFCSFGEHDVGFVGAEIELGSFGWARVGHAGWGGFEA